MGSSYKGKDYNSIGLNVYRLTLVFLEKFREFENVKPNELSVLVVGCAYGYECKACVDFGFKRVVGVDISSFAIREAKKTFPEIEFYEADACNLDLFGQNEFEVVMANNLLEHIPDPRKALNEFYRVTSKYALIRVDNVLCLEVYNSLPLTFRKIISRIKRIPLELDTDLTHISQLPRYKWIQLFNMKFKVKRIFRISKLPFWLSGYHYYILEKRG